MRNDTDRHAPIDDGRRAADSDAAEARGSASGRAGFHTWVAVMLVLVALALTSALMIGCSCGPTASAEMGETETPDATGPTDSAGGPATGVPASAGEATLLQVIDGDTIRVRMPDGSAEKVRYIGIDAPEVAHSDSPGEYLGDDATAHNTELLGSGLLRLETDVDERDDFGRLLAYVWAGDVFINERMVLDGYARAHNYPPNIARQDQLWEAHDKARAAGIGIWSQ